jgi:iron complex transport system permease protein
MALIGLFALLLFIFALSLTLGSVSIPLGDVITVLLGGSPQKATWVDIVLKFRLPKAITAALAGAALGVSGLQMQTLFRNPLADPFVLGISSGASLGVALVVLSAGAMGAGSFLFGLGLAGNLGVVIAASLGSGIVLLLVLVVSQRVQSSVTLLILGLMFGYITGAIVSIFLYFSIAERIQAYVTWTFGSFGGVTWVQIQIFAPVILIGLLLALILSKQLNSLLLGDDYARSMGLDVKRARLWIILSTALLAGGVTAFCGPIGFLGIAVPHLCRAVFNSSDHRILVPGTIMMGAILALLADIVAQMPGQNVILPLNAVTALLGAPVVTWVILRQRNLKAAMG